jgi:hypothetical protein
MRNSDVDTIMGLQSALRIFKMKFPDAVWSIGEPPFTPARKAKKERLREDGSVAQPAAPAVPFDVYVATDSDIGEKHHVFRLVETDNVAETMYQAMAEIEVEYGRRMNKTWDYSTNRWAVDRIVSS